MVAKRTSWKNDGLQISLMLRDAKNTTLKLRSAQTEILALKKEDDAWKVRMAKKDAKPGAKLKVSRRMVENYHKEREELQRQRMEAMNIVSNNKVEE